MIRFFRIIIVYIFYSIISEKGYQFFFTPQKYKKKYLLNTISRKSFKQSERKAKSDKAKTALIQHQNGFL